MIVVEMKWVHYQDDIIVAVGLKEVILPFL
jgi:hypothetical protein